MVMMWLTLYIFTATFLFFLVLTFIINVARHRNLQIILIVQIPHICQMHQLLRLYNNLIKLIFIILINLIVIRIYLQLMLLHLIGSIFLTMLYVITINETATAAAFEFHLFKKASVGPRNVLGYSFSQVDGACMRCFFFLVFNKLTNVLDGLN